MKTTEDQPAIKARSVGIRIDEALLQEIDNYCEARDWKYSRSQLMSHCAVRQAKLILRDKAPTYWASNDSPFWKETSYPITTSIHLYEDEEAVINEACARTNHKIGPFVVWATIAMLRDGGGSKKKKKKGG